MQNFKSITAMVNELQKEDEESVKIMYFITRVIFSSNFLHAVTFLHVLHLHIIETETESED